MRRHGEFDTMARKSAANKLVRRRVEDILGRTGIAPNDAAVALATQIAGLPNLVLDGLSAYDGQVHDNAIEDRLQSTTPGVQRTLELCDRLEGAGLQCCAAGAGGDANLSHPRLARAPRGGVLAGDLHAARYRLRHAYPDLPFIPAAFLLGRVISQPRPGRLCLDLGHKAVAADPPAGSRLTLLDIPDATVGIHSEEHLVVDTPHALDYPPGTPVRALPTHICPTCALHRRAYVIEDGELVDEWVIAARDRVLNI